MSDQNFRRQLAYKDRGELAYLIRSSRNTLPGKNIRISRDVIGDKSWIGLAALRLSESRGIFCADKMSHVKPQVALINKRETAKLFQHADIGNIENVAQRLSPHLKVNFSKIVELEVGGIALYGRGEEPFIGIRFRGTQLEEERRELQDIICGITNNTNYRWPHAEPHLSLAKASFIANDIQIGELLEGYLPKTVRLNPATITQFR